MLSKVDKLRATMRQLVKIEMMPPHGVPKLDAPLKFIVIGAPKRSIDASSSLRFFINY